MGQGSDFATGLAGADGLAIDCAGNVYLAQSKGGALVVVSPDGEQLGEIADLPETVTNAAFGGADRRTLYITTRTVLFAVTLPIPGLPYWPYARARRRAHGMTGSVVWLRQELFSESIALGQRLRQSCEGRR